MKLNIIKRYSVSYCEARAAVCRDDLLG